MYILSLIRAGDNEYSNFDDVDDYGGNDDLALTMMMTITSERWLMLIYILSPIRVFDKEDYK